MEMMVVNGDTIYFAPPLADVIVTAPRKKMTPMERAIYHRYRRYAAKVYPYAVEAVKLYRQMEEATRGRSKRYRRRYIRKAKREYKPKYKDELKNLTRTQGYILTKMIEKELGKPMYEVIKETRGTLSAMYWNTAGRAYGYHLRKQYKQGDDPILDMVLREIEVKYQDKKPMPKDTQ